MHPTHSWYALVLGSTPASDADKRICLLSAEQGIIWARAKSIREERSKLRYSLSDYVHAYVSVVRGKYGWRITGALHKDSIHTASAHAVFARLARLVQRLTVPDADGAQRVYAPLAAAHAALCSNTALHDEIEILTALRVLFALGYVAPRGEYESALASTELTDELMALVGGRRTLVLADINKALSESQL